MKRLAFTIWAFLSLWLMAPQADGAIHRLSDEYLDTVHAQGLIVYLDYNMFVPNLDGTLDLSQVIAGATLPGSASQTLGNGATGIQNGVQLNDNAQSNLNSLLNLNAANSAVPIGINITVINGDNNGAVNQTNTSLGILNSLLVWSGTL
ncbi:MAG TPA: hypothetical protein DDW94_06495 [Deltaproteobacteria bacterium]|nr:MAG: hypothetical protein A2Z79_01025 [Deltaproteobacteria bacterium GWA2_55_82]OGQ64239.1 MAG: hypothetical protein A3I81_12900 [Deltaproteobacteria bacterium RIFCSPLOWO2_02_FULL_55_12]OIJ74020.1 MAG: hypothetical protein A2V21_306935 [Deltaproteobacteria bacterium GWC2_55_46]HBG46626.1 hypothetical protein [Deltaproteobacteria bacterium]HCY11366.1 hypothetical protein [Deltaproteobacteria bacterium]